MDSASLAAEVSSAHWYHSIELGGGLVTPGEYELKGACERVPMPRSLDGMRCLDVGTRDGFWAFEMERRGASEVVAIDLDDPTALDWPGPPAPIDEAGRTAWERSGTAFAIAHGALGSTVVRRDLSVYELSPERVGRFDFAFIGTLLLHLRDPIGALRAVQGVLDGTLISNDVVSPLMTLLHPRRPTAELLMRGEPFWAIPNQAARRRLVEAAGFEVVASGRPYLIAYGAGGRRPPLRLSLNRLVAQLGAPHSWVLARPANMPAPR